MPPLPTDIEVENVLILVGDAVRHDVAADRLARRGPTYQTVAASLHTPTSFATMLTGQHPTRHGVYGFHEQLPTDDHLFSLDGYTTGFLDAEASMNDWLAERQQLFGPQPSHAVTDVDTPFLLVHRDFGGHAPYHRYSNDGDPDTVPHHNYLKRHAGDVEFFRSEYERSIDSWLERVDDVLEELDGLGVRDETLVVVASDHGEVLGEHGHVGHDYPAIPALTQVPTTFVHPDLEPGRVEDGVARHIDLVPTLLDALGEPVPRDLPGRVLQHEGTAEHGVCYYNRALNDYFTRVGVSVANRLPTLQMEIESVWDADGGYCFNRSAIHEKLLTYLFRTLVLPQGRTTIKRREFREAYRVLVNDVVKHGEPGFSETDAAAILDRELPSKAETSYEWELDAASEAQLEDLGYL